MPGTEAGETVLLPIDSKFPGDTYSNLLSAYESGDAAELKSRRAALETEMKRCAKVFVTSILIRHTLQILQ